MAESLSWSEAERRYTRGLTPGEVIEAFPEEARELAPQRLALAEEALKAYYHRYITPVVQSAHPEDRPIVELLVTARWPNYEIVKELTCRIRHLRAIVNEIQRRQRPQRFRGRIDEGAIQRARGYPLPQLCEESGVQLRRSGRTWRGRCPFHDDRKPSFVVYPGENRFYCFGCHQGGDPIDFLCRMEGLSFTEAVRRLAK